ncbi:MAG: lipopolysaccharide assembly protein LapA domain-containing protein [Aestuariibacter sp.]
MKFVIYLIIFIAVAFLAIIFGAENEQVTEINYLLAKSEVRVSTLLAISILIGSIFASAFWLIYALNLRVRIVSLRRQLNKSLKKPS